MKTIAIMNNKGGVGKTVTAINLADILARKYRKRVVLVDCDGQMNLTRFFLLSVPVRFCNFSPNGECKKMADKGVQPLNDYTCRFRPSSLKCTDKSGLDGLQADKWYGNQGCIHPHAARRKMTFHFGEKLHF